MRTYGWFLRALWLCPLIATGFLARAATPMTKLSIEVKNDSGKPVDRASVVVRFVEGRDYLKLGKKIRTTYELRTNQEGGASIPEIPQGKILIQVIAKGLHLPPHGHRGGQQGCVVGRCFCESLWS